MQLLHDYVAIERDQEPEKTKSGLYLSEQIKNLPPTGVVRYVGPKVKEVKPGDRVVYKVYSSVDIAQEGLDVLPIIGVMAKL